MSKRILNLEREELPLLEGKIGTIEVQDGCSEHCVICGADAPDYKGSMDWNLFERLCEGIAEVKDADGIKLVENKVAPFYQSNPPRYRSEDKTLFDIVTKLERTLDVSTYITVAGWKPGDNYMQHAIEQIVEQKKGIAKELLERLAKKPKNRLKTHINYSVKTAGALARSDYLKFLDSVLGTTDVETVIRSKYKIEESIGDFLEQSRYAHQLTENMRTLKGSGAVFMVQYVQDPRVLPLEYRVFEYLFDKELIEKLFDICKKRSGTRFRSELRTFGGVGRAHTLLEIDLRKCYVNRATYIESGCNPGCELEEEDFFYTATVNHDGSIRLDYSVTDDLSLTLIPKEFFIARSQFYEGRDKAKSREYAMLANLQGRNLLR